jgi:hypothetical protein
MLAVVRGMEQVESAMRFSPVHAPLCSWLLAAGIMVISVCGLDVGWGNSKMFGWTRHSVLMINGR